MPSEGHHHDYTPNIPSGYNSGRRRCDIRAAQLRAVEGWLSKASRMSAHFARPVSACKFIEALQRSSLL